MFYIAIFCLFCLLKNVKSGHSLLQTCSESASNLSMEKDVRPKNDDQQELERVHYPYVLVKRIFRQILSIWIEEDVIMKQLSAVE